MDYINEFLLLSDELGDKYEVQIPKPTVVVLGSYNSGKSTLINGLLQTRISPVDIVPSTKGTIRFQYGKTFYAEVNYGKFKSRKFQQEKDFLQSLSGKNNGYFEMAEVFLNNALLKKITLVDTPGLDGPFMHNRSLDKLIKNADLLVYLFHQRGIEEFNKRWLLQSVYSSKPKDIPEMSFWINCNLGNFDGTSLEETRTVLQEIFSGLPQLYTVNTLDNQNLALFRLYLESVMAIKIMRKVRQVMLQKDMSINQLVEQTVNTTFEAEFLLEYSRLRQTVEALLEDKDMTDFAPYTKHLKYLLESNNISNITKSIQLPVIDILQKNSLSFTEVKGHLLDLIDRLRVTGRADKDKQTVYPIQKAIEELAGKIRKERFTIVATGGFSSGKSTFFNALMGEEVLPAQNKPTTFAITQIGYGNYKKAVVHLASQVTLQLYDKIKGKIEPRTDELNTLSQWLTQNPREITSYELYENRRFKSASHAECINILRTFREMSSRQTENLQTMAILQDNLAMENLSVPSKYKTVSLKLFNHKYLTEKVRITFRQSDLMSFDLETASGVKAFQATVNCSNSFRLDRVEVYHPSEYLKTATFLDTPGLDSTHKYHSEITTDYLQKSDIYLIFINARHILFNREADNPVEIIFSRIKEYLKGNPRAYKKIFYILNFADTLTKTEREKVTDLLRQRLSNAASQMQIYAVSSLSALLQKDDGSFQRLLNDIELSVSDYRGKKILSGYIQEIKFLLNMVNNSYDAENIKSVSKIQLLKFIPTCYILKCKSELVKEVNIRFTQLGYLIKELSSEQDFTGFLLGRKEQKKYLFYKVETLSCMSYFQWAAELNSYITNSCNTAAEMTEQDINSHLVTLNGTSHRQHKNYILPKDRTQTKGLVTSELEENQLSFLATIHLNTALPETLSVSPVLKKLSVALEQNRGLFGRVKEREIQREMSKFLTGEQQKLIRNIEKWENDLHKEIASKLGPIYSGLIENHIITDSTMTTSGHILPTVQKNYNPALDIYLKELKEIENLLELMGGN